VTASREPRVARLTWQAGDPGALVAELGRRLGFDAGGGSSGTGVEAGERGGVGGVRLVFGDETVDVVPWRREGPADEPAGDGRLVFEPSWGDGDGEHVVADDRPLVVVPLVVAGVAWATVDLDRAADELGPWLLPADAGDHEEPLLGATARPRPTRDLPGPVIVLLEPVTEGRLAASLARDGEGPCALYLRPTEGLDSWVAAARRRGVAVSRRRVGPLGSGVLVPGTSVAGPHLVIVDRRRPSSRGRGPGTIAP
jgi:hypothetical protein